jgi:hypothetical protein
MTTSLGCRLWEERRDRDGQSPAAPANASMVDKAEFDADSNSGSIPLSASIPLFPAQRDKQFVLLEPGGNALR